MDFSFLKAPRFWALVIGGLSVAAEGNFTLDAWLKGLMVIVAGFVTVRTIDRTVDKVS
jgi:hypothetical protein